MYRHITCSIHPSPKGLLWSPPLPPKRLFHPERPCCCPLLPCGQSSKVNECLWCILVHPQWRTQWAPNPSIGILDTVPSHMVLGTCTWSFQHDSSLHSSSNFLSDTSGTAMCYHWSLSQLPKKRYCNQPSSPLAPVSHLLTASSLWRKIRSDHHPESST